MIMALISGTLMLIQMRVMIPVTFCLPSPVAVMTTTATMYQQHQHKRRPTTRDPSLETMTMSTTTMS